MFLGSFPGTFGNLSGKLSVGTTKTGYGTTKTGYGTTKIGYGTTKTGYLRDHPSRVQGWESVRVGTLMFLGNLKDSKFNRKGY